jgi:DNA repair protein RecN (Recombination protein N)
MALKRIMLRDFVIVKELDLDLDSGFTVLTGETGAGKSILIDALQLALGARGDPGVVREGAQRADISAEFDCPDDLHAQLDEGGFDTGEHVLLRRTVDSQGKSRAWINGGPATMAQLRALGESLLDIHGQHAWQSLTRPDAVRQLLDAYARLDTRPLLQLWQQWRESRSALEHAKAAQDSSQREQERLLWQISEVEKLAPGEHEWEDLNAQHARLSHAQTLLDAAQRATDVLEQEDGGASATLARAQSLLQESAHLEPEFKAIAEVLASSLAQVEDATHSLHAYLRGAGDMDPSRLAELDERLSLWISLARRYRRTPEELPGLLAAWRTELGQLQAAVDLPALQARERECAQAYDALAKTVSQARQKAAPALSKSITQSMQQLGMQGGRFEVALEPSEPSSSGLEEVQFLVAGHAGVTPRPVSKVASGGELSRIALAIAVTTSQLGTAQTLIFDEVDSGVGGAVAETVGRLLKQLGADRQVLAVTHLPQVAACADHHLVVSKRSDAHGAASTVGAVEGELRTSEIARMLGGERLSNATLAHASEMLQAHRNPAGSR